MAVGAIAASMWLAAGLGCAKMVTLSEPRSDAYLEAMAAAKRDHHAGRMRSAARHFAEAAEAAERRVDRDEARYRQAKALQRAGCTQAAIALLERIAARRPVSRRTVRASYDASVLRHRSGDREGALRGWRELVRSHPDAGIASSALGRVLRDYADHDDADGALRYARRTYAQVQGSELADDLLMSQAELLLERGDRDSARAALERIVRLHPYPQGGLWDDALRTLADMALEDGDAPAAIGHLKRMVARRDETSVVGSYTLPTFPEAQLQIARLYRDEVGDPEAASAHFMRLYRDYETSTLRDDALVEAGEMWLGTGQRTRGCELLRRAVSEFEVGSARRRAVRRLREGC